MFKRLGLAVFLAGAPLALTGAAHAAPAFSAPAFGTPAFSTPAFSTMGGNPLVQKIAEGCGPGWVRNAWGRCRPIGGPVLRVVCPPRYHFGRFGRCWPNY
jgi:hypothetical protein